jgi:hypothetical protein
MGTVRLSYRDLGIALARQCCREVSCMRRSRTAAAELPPCERCGTATGYPP